MYTYNDLSEAMNATWCKDCPSGYFCDDIAIANYSRFPCPAGFFCEQASNEPIPCPGGTYRYVRTYLIEMADIKILMSMRCQYAELRYINISQYL